MKNIKLLMGALLFSAAVQAQRMDITLTDNSVLSLDISKIQSMEFFEAAEPGQIEGHWYTGYRVFGTTVTSYDSPDHLDFNGNKLKWESATGETVYTLTYADDKRSFTAEDESGATSKYSIIAMENELLVIKKGSTSTFYLYKSRDAARSTERVAFPSRNEQTDITKILTFTGGKSNSTKTPMGKHFEQFLSHVTSDADRAYFEDATQQPTFTKDEFKYWKEKTVNLYPFGTPQPADVNQHALGNCCMCAVLSSLAYLYPDYIKHMITVNGNTYRVAMFDPHGEPVDVVVDNTFLCKSNGELCQLTGKNNAITWATILEKALMKWESIYKCNGIEGIGTEHAAPPFTGCGNSFSVSPGTMYNYEMQKVVDYAMQNGMISIGGFNKGGLKCGKLESVTGHAFTLMYTTQPDDYLWSMRNPWGIDSGSDKVDGVLEIPNRRDIVNTIDFRIVEPGAAKEYLRKDLGGYVRPRYTPRKDDLGVSKELLRQCGIVVDDDEEPAN